MLGYTQTELETSFAAWLAHFATHTDSTPAQIVAQVAQHYNGYRFSTHPAKVYNPYIALQTRHPE